MTGVQTCALPSLKTAQENLRTAEGKLTDATETSKATTDKFKRAIDDAKQATKQHANEVSFGAGRLAFFGDKAATARAEIARRDAYERGASVMRTLGRDAGGTATQLGRVASEASNAAAHIKQIPTSWHTTITVTTVGGDLPAGTAGGLASGGPVSRSGMFLVGEEGPELVRLPKGAHVFDADQTDRMLDGGSGGSPVMVNVDRLEVRDELDAELIGSALAARLAVLR